VVGGGQDVEGPGEGRRHSVPEGLDLRVGEQAEGATGDPLVEGATTGDGFEAPDEPASAGCRGVPQGSVADLAGDTVAAPVEAAADDHTGGDPRSQADVDDVGDLGPVPSDMAVGSQGGGADVVLDGHRCPQALPEHGCQGERCAVESEVDGMADGARFGVHEARNPDPDHLRVRSRRELRDDRGDAGGQGFAAPRRGRDFEAVADPAGEPSHADGGSADVDADARPHRRTTPSSSRMTMAAAPASTGSSIPLPETDRWGRRDRWIRAVISSAMAAM